VLDGIHLIKEELTVLGDGVGRSRGSSGPGGRSSDVAATQQDAVPVSPGLLRVGWIRVQRPAIAQFGQLKAVADLGTSLFTQAIAVNLLADAERVRAPRSRELTGRLAFLQELLHPPGVGMAGIPGPLRSQGSSRIEVIV
jgi:hypothetical protein